MKLDYAAINARAMNLLLSAKKHVSSIDPGLKALVELRVSQINGCAYCLDLHANEARKAGVPQQKLDCLAAFAESGLFTADEVVALRWAESVTNIASASDLDGELVALSEQFGDVEVVDLTLAIAMMNCLNRLSISFGDVPVARGE